MYDKVVALRSLAHVTVGASVALFITHNHTDADVWRVLKTLRIDPDLAMPATRHAAAMYNATVAAFPRTHNLTGKAAAFWLKATDVMLQAPSPARLWNATRYLGTTSYTFAQRSGMYNKSVEAALGMFNASLGPEMLNAGFAEFENFQSGTLAESAEAWIDAAESQTRRSLLQLRTCPVLSTFVTSAVQCAQVAETHFKYNIPRATCGLIHNTKDKGLNDCPPSSWVVATTTKTPPPPQTSKPPPPKTPPPSPPLFAFPPPARAPSSIGDSSNKLKEVSVLQTGVLNALSYITGTDFPKYVERWMTWLVTATPGIISDSVDASSFKCDFNDSIMCLQRNPDLGLLAAAVSNWMYLLLLVIGLRVIGLGLLSYPTVVSCVSFLVRTHNV
jgi:hypothetical protein